jgi:hypothetical protein
MGRGHAALIENAWIRWVAAVVLIAVGTFAVMTPDERAMFGTKLDLFIGWTYSPID